MSEKEFDIIIKNKLSDSNYVPTNEGWTQLQAKINVPATKPLPSGSHASLTTNSIHSWHKWLYAAAALIPICAVAYIAATNTNTASQLNTSKAPTDKIENVAHSTTTLDTNNKTITINNKPIENNATIFNNNISDANSATKAANRFVAKFKNVTRMNKQALIYKSTNTVAETIGNNVSNYNKTNSTAIASNNTETPIAQNPISQALLSNNAHTQPTVKVNSITEQVREVLRKQDNTNMPNINNAVAYNKNAKQNNARLSTTNKMQYSIIAGLGASSASVAIKQAGVAVQRKINKRLYADATMQISSQSPNLLPYSNKKLALSTHYDQDINVLTSNYAPSTQIESSQKRLAVNRIPLTQMVYNPSIGYKTSRKTYVAIGAEIAKTLKNGDLKQLENDLNMGIASSGSFGTASANTKLDNWDAGLTAKAGINITKHFTAEAKYREGVTNVVENINGNTRRSYGLIGLIYRIR